MNKLKLTNTIEENYPVNVRISLLITILLFIALFLLFPKYTPRPYKLRRITAPTKMESIEEQKISKIEEPPPVAKPKIAIEAKSDEEVEQQTITTTTFKVDEPPPIKTKIQFYRVYEKPPILLTDPKAEYPEIAKKMGLEGKVFIEIDVDSTGSVCNARILSSSNEIFNEYALRAARRLRFKPAEARGRAISVRVTWPIVFTLEK